MAKIQIWCVYLNIFHLIVNFFKPQNHHLLKRWNSMIHNRPNWSILCFILNEYFSFFILNKYFSLSVECDLGVGLVVEPVEPLVLLSKFLTFPIKNCNRFLIAEMYKKWILGIVRGKLFLRVPVTKFNGLLWKSKIQKNVGFFSLMII